MTFSPFDVARGISTNVGTALRERRDVSAIDNILSGAIESNDPSVLQNSIGKILSQVSPERQGVALNLLQNRIANLEAQKKQQKTGAAYRQAGLDEESQYLPPQVVAQQMKEQGKQGRLAQYGLGQPQQGMQPQQSQEEMAQAEMQQQSQQSRAFPRDYSNEELELLTGAQDREISEPAKSALKNRREEEKAARSTYEPESEKLEAKRVAQFADEIEKDYRGAVSEDQRLTRMENLDKSKTVSAPLLVKALDFSGLPIGILSNPSTEEFRKLEADFVRDVSKVFPGGRITNYEIQAFLKSVPTLMNSPEGRKSIIRNRKLFNEAKKIRFNEYKKIIQENNGKKPQNLGILLEERTEDKLADIEDKFLSGMESEIEKFQQPIRMIDPQGIPVNIPPNQIERALQAGAKFS